MISYDATYEIEWPPPTTRFPVGHLARATFRLDESTALPPVTI